MLGFADLTDDDGLPPDPGHPMHLTPRLALMLSVPPLLWAGNAVVGRIAIASIAPLWLNVARWALALLLILPLGWRAWGSAGARAAIALRWRHLALLSLTGVGAYNALQYMALTTSTPPERDADRRQLAVCMMAIGALAYGERPRPAQALGALLSLAGVAVVLSRGDAAALLRVRLVSGDLLMLGAVVCWSVYSWLLARPPAAMRGAARPRWDWAEFLVVQIVPGLGWATLAAGLGQWLAPAVPLRWSLGLALAMVYVAVGPRSSPTGCGDWAWRRPVRRWPRSWPI